MRHRFTGTAILLLTFSACACAGTVDVTSNQTISIAQGATVEFGFNVANFARASSGFNPYPTSLSFQMFGQAGSGQTSAALPGSSQQYESQYLLDAMLTSADGNYSVPLVNSAATRLGLTSGSMVVTPGSLQGSQNANLNLINASAQLSQQQSAQIFGANVASSSDMAYIVLHNDGPALLLGLGAGYDLRSAMVVSGVTGAAPFSTGGMTTQVNSVAPTPEPRTAVLLAGAFGLLAAFGIFGRSKRVSA